MLLSSDMQSKLLAALAGLILFALSAPIVQGAQRGSTTLVTTIQLDNAESWDAQGSVNNTILSLDVGTDTITSIGWDLTIETVGESWRSEVAFRLTDIAGNPFLTFSPGALDNSPGTSTYTTPGPLDLTDYAIPNIFLAEGVLLIEIFESFDHLAGAVDARINGQLLIGRNDIVGPPAPGALALFGVAGIFASRRR